MHHCIVLFSFGLLHMSQYIYMYIYIFFLLRFLLSSSVLDVRQSLPPTQDSLGSTHRILSKPRAARIVRATKTLSLRSSKFPIHKPFASLLISLGLYMLLVSHAKSSFTQTEFFLIRYSVILSTQQVSEGPVGDTAAWVARALQVKNQCGLLQQSIHLSQLAIAYPSADRAI